MLIKSGIIVALLTLVSRVFGMFRELFIATTFGTSAYADAVNIAFKLPNLFRRILGEGALSSVFVPIFTEKLNLSKDSAKEFASKVIFWLFLLLVLIVVLMEYFMPEIMLLLAPGFTADPGKFELTVLLCRISIFYLIFVSLVAIIGGMLNSVGRFAAFASTPIIMNIVIILGTILFDNYIENYYAINIAIVLAGIIQLAVIVWYMCRAGLYLNIPQVSYHDKDITKLLRLMGPATITAGAMQINLFISQSIASFIPGAVSILSYADRLYQLPLSLIGVTFGTILLPELSRLYKSRAIDQARKTQDQAIKFGLFLTLPCSVVLVVMCQPIISLIYEYGAFRAEDTIATASAIAAFSLGLPAFVLTKIFMPIFFAHSDTKTPMKITLYGIVVNIVLNVILMQLFGFVGIALGSSIASWYGVYLSIKYTYRYDYFHITKDLMLFIFKIIFAGFVAGIFTYYFYNYLDIQFIKDDLISRLIIVFIPLVSCFTIYLIITFLTLTRENKRLVTEQILARLLRR